MTPTSSPAATATAQNQTSPPKNARVSALTTTAVPVPISSYSTRGASSPQSTPPIRPRIAETASAARNQAATRTGDIRAGGAGAYEPNGGDPGWAGQGGPDIPGVSGCSGIG